MNVHEFLHAPSEYVSRKIATCYSRKVCTSLTTATDGNNNLDVRVLLLHLDESSYATVNAIHLDFGIGVFITKLLVMSA